MTQEELKTWIETGEVPESIRFAAAAEAEKQAACDHAGWSWKTQGRCCFKCGALMVDFGD